LFAAVNSGAVTKTFVQSMPEHGWYRISVPKDKYAFFYDGIKDAFRRTFNAELQLSIDLDIFFIDDFDNHWSSN
jgi:hypothetical protein